MTKHPLQRLASAGVTTDELFEGFLLIGGCSTARRDAIMAKRRGDWDAYEKALDELTDEELSQEVGHCQPNDTALSTCKLIVTLMVNVTTQFAAKCGQQ